MLNQVNLVRFKTIFILQITYIITKLFQNLESKIVEIGASNVKPALGV